MADQTVVAMGNLVNGHRVKDVIGGFEGTAIGHVAYLTGCNQTLVTPDIDKDGKHNEAQWYDDQRLELVDPSAEPITLPNEKTPGGAAPTR